MVRHHEEIERTVNLHALAGLGEDHRNTAREAIGAVDIRAGKACGEGIYRIARMHMRITPQEHAVAQRQRVCGRRGSNSHVLRWSGGRFRTLLAGSKRKCRDRCEQEAGLH